MILQRAAFVFRLISSSVCVAMLLSACGGHDVTPATTQPTSLQGAGAAAQTPGTVTRSVSSQSQPNAKPFFDYKSVLARSDVQDLGSAPPNDMVTLEFVVPERNTAQRDQLLKSVHDPKSGQYLHFLTHQQYIEQFAPTASDYAAAVTNLTAHGFKLIQSDPNRQIIVAQSTVDVADKVLGLATHLVRQNGVLRHMQTADESIPSDLAPSVAFVVGTSEVVTASTPHKAGVAHPNPKLASLRASGASPAALNGPIYGPSGSGVGDPGLANSYQLPVQYGYDGTGHAVAFVVDNDPSQSDLSLYLSYFQITRTGGFVRRAIDGGGPGFNPSSQSSVEANLDYQTEAGLAPGATVYEYSIPDLSWGHIYDAMVSAVADNVADAVSMSITGCERSAPSSTLGAMNNILHQADLQGITFSAATGDSGLFYCYQNGGYILYGIGAPASTPDITAVGGTDAGAVGTSYPYTNQSGWSGSGGGYSAIWGTPPYQSYLSFLPSRSVPDISLAADNGGDVPNDGAAIYMNGQPYITGGTSWASPIFAAFQATWNQETGFRRGFANVAMYAANQSAGYSYDCLTDITTGNNGSQAAVGWDYVTGLGSMYWGCSF